MKTECQSISEVERKLDVTIDGDQILKELDRAYRKLGQRVKIPGFRQGKVPRHVLEKYYKGDVENDVIGKLISSSYSDAVDQHSLHPVNQPQIQNQEFIPGQDFRYSARVEIRPELEVKNYKGLTVERPGSDVTDADVEAELERQRGYHAQVVPVEDRTEIEKGDLVACNFTGTVDGESFKGGNGVGYVIDTAEPNFLVPVVEALPGKSLSQKFEIDAELPTEFPNKDVAGKTAHFEITPVQLKRKQLPALDDEFAKDLGEFETLAEMRDKTRERLAKRAQDEAEDKYRDAVIDALIKENAFEIPPSLIERQLDLMLYQTLGNIPMPQLKAMGIDPNMLRTDMRSRAEWRVRRGMVLEGIADQEKIEIDSEAIEAKFKELSERLGQPEAKVRGAYKGDRIEELTFSMRLERALDLVIANLAGGTAVDK
ncbi:MAG: trigger factor [Pseudomonadota bacterium]